MPEARHRLARERHVHFVDRERVQLVETGENARRFGHELRPDAGAGQARDLLRMVHVHAATSWNTSDRETRSPPSASRLKRANAESSCWRSSSSPASLHARANAWRPECSPSGSVIVSPSHAGSMIWYVAASLSTPSWLIPASCANAFAPTTALFGWTTYPVSSETSFEAAVICVVSMPVSTLK